ncbi:host-nuclease inhibitor Gam family protein [Stygiobacter electus]|uniref:Host-nuclease inhibitor Gam family protein n=1 Tax=Stygiobacter electus TaxID=3032292 RepID=A0AAE3TET9_9BACT|nr:host-nuclease inhibitor Gam family protein [Stygiobacter electus]MDF1612618.1 host-nuclease inhibitor Gam family protein [Stygiobacter electus]
MNDNFIEELLTEIENKEKEDQLAYCDLLLIEANKIEEEMNKNQSQCEKEIEIIKEWMINKNVKLQERYELIKSKLNAIMLTTEKKTIELPNGIMKIRKQPDKVEIVDLELFLKNATKEMVTIIPEKLKPDLNKIKHYIKLTNKMPIGITLIEGKEEFTIKLKKEIGNDTENKT